jgi:hypothetical protein
LYTYKQLQKEQLTLPQISTPIPARPGTMDKAGILKELQTIHERLQDLGKVLPN